MLKNLDSVMLVLVLTKIDRLLTRGTRAFQLLSIMHYILQLVIVPNLFFATQKTPSYMESVITCQIVTLENTPGI